jgi:hypothetical protein
LDDAADATNDTTEVDDVNDWWGGKWI